MTIKAILACDDAGGIAKDGEMPWPKNKRDMEWFRSHTTGHVVIMGSSTWNSKGMPKPLSDRVNIVATNQDPDLFECDGVVKNNLLLATMRVQDMYLANDVWVIGGANIVEQTLPAVEEFLITRIKGNFDCDTFLDLETIQSKYELAESEEHEDVTFETWKKKRD